MSPSAWLGREIAKIVVQRMLDGLMPMTGCSSPRSRAAGARTGSPLLRYGRERYGGQR